MSVGDAKSAVTRLRLAVARRPEHAPARRNLARAELACGNLAHAAETLRYSEASDHDAVSTLYLTALIDLRAGRAAKAIPRLCRVVHHDPLCVAAWVQLALAERIHGDVTAAEATFERVCSLDPTHLEATRPRAELVASPGNGGRWKPPFPGCFVSAATTHHRERISKRAPTRAWRNRGQGNPGRVAGRRAGVDNRAANPHQFPLETSHDPSCPPPCDIRPPSRPIRGDPHAASPDGRCADRVWDT